MAWWVGGEVSLVSLEVLGIDEERVLDVEERGEFFGD